MINQVKHRNETIQIDLPQEIHVQEATALREELLRHIEKGGQKFRLNFSSTKFIDSAGLGVLVTLTKRLKHSEESVDIEGASASIQDLFQLTRLAASFSWK